jgi:putative sigma-54 modulation protein
MNMSRKAKALQFADEGYNIQITGRHIQITDAMKAYAIDKASKIERFSDRIIDINIILDTQKLEHRAEIILKVGHTKIRGQASSDDMYISIDRAAAKIESQLRRYRERLRDYHAKGISALEMNVSLIPRSNEEEKEEEEDGIDVDMANDGSFELPEIVKQETIPLKMLTLDEAVMKMELSGDAFLLFKCEEDQRLKVMYRRNDGNFGVIEPDCK